MSKHLSRQSFLTQGLFDSTSLVSWGSSRGGASKDANFFKKLGFLGLVRYFSAKIIVYIVIVFYNEARAVRALSFGLLHWLPGQRQHY